MKNKFLFTAGIVGMLSNIASGATGGADADVGRDWNPYVTLRGGWVFGGKAKYNYHRLGEDATVRPPLYDEKTVSTGKNLGSAWSGSGEVGVSLYEDRVSVGLELGYFTGKGKISFAGHDISDYDVDGYCNFDEISGDGYLRTNGKYKNLFAAVNVTLKKELGERSFLYGGVGVGMARSDFGSIDYKYIDQHHGMEYHDGKINFKAKWRFLGQAFGGLGFYLNENWSLTVGYRLRYLAGDGRESGKFSHDKVKWDWTVKQDMLHAAEVGLTYRF